ncbi:hypothetical protein QTH90_29790 [Variovorax sp. J2P1-59]|uniref:hypothetical protein n=1 Tax=Variovorax flavidus TaxID=3053501 RepID=UPI0025769A83|nr:hypothetical protein [Variovorax sp. J2P1-59]MDM0078632.1 hypothetical protein [Variovorax sp. J2P1-59]
MTHSDGDADFEYRGWSVHIDRTDSNCSPAHAELHYRGTCRLCIAIRSEGMDPACIGWALDSSACNFIDECSHETQRARSTTCS